MSPRASRKVFRAVLGFTLVELLVALTIVGLLLAVVPMAYGKLKENTEYRTAVRNLVTELRAARNLAMQTGSDQALVVDLDARRFQVNQRREFEFPDSLRIAGEFAEIETEADRIGAIRFYPDGSSTGGSISLLRPNGDGVRVRVDWLLGRVTQEPPG